MTLQNEIEKILSKYAKVLWEAMHEVEYTHKLTSESPVYEIKEATKIAEDITTLIQDRERKAYIAGRHGVKGLKNYEEYLESVKPNEKEEYELVHTCKPDKNGYAVCSCCTYKPTNSQPANIEKIKEAFYIDFKFDFDYSVNPLKSVVDVWKFFLPYLEGKSESVKE